MWTIWQPVCQSHVLWERERERDREREKERGTLLFNVSLVLLNKLLSAPSCCYLFNNMLPPQTHTCCYDNGLTGEKILRPLSQRYVFTNCTKTYFWGRMLITLLVERKWKDESVSYFDLVCICACLFGQILFSYLFLLVYFIVHKLYSKQNHFIASHKSNKTW